MTEYSIGPGVAQSIAENQDEARSDEQYLVLGPPGHKISLTLARDAQYWYYEEDNRVNRLPF